MATVVGVTYQRALEIEQGSIESGRVDQQTGRLILTRRDGGSTDAGSVRSPREVITYNSSAYFYKNTRPSATAFLFQIWGGGGAGGAGSFASPGGGGGGGGYTEILLAAASLPAQVTLLVGAGGPTHGSGGGASYISLADGEIYGVGGGGSGSRGESTGWDSVGGGGGGMTFFGIPSGGSNGSSSTSGTSGGSGPPQNQFPDPFYPVVGKDGTNPHQGGSGAIGPTTGGYSWYGGGGGNCGQSLYGGGGGGWGGSTYYAASAPGLSRFGGNGGYGGPMNAPGASGIYPSGGGGGGGVSTTPDWTHGGSGANGRIIMTVYYN